MASNAAKLDDLILDAERAVIERDQRLRGQVQALQAGVKARASRALAIGAGVLAGGVVLGLLLWRSRSPTAATLRRGMRRPLASGRHALARMPWLKLLPLAWPLLPLTWRKQLPPGTTALLAAIGAPVLARAAHDIHQEPPESAAGFDLTRYLGRWYEIARLPLATEAICEEDVIAHYSVQDVAVGVVNECRDAAGEIRAVHGRAIVPDLAHPERLKVTFVPHWLRWLPPVWADYWVLHVDPDYRMALVGTPDRRHLWLLARTPDLLPEDYQRLCNEARLRGYEPARLQKTVQSAATPSAAAAR